MAKEVMYRQASDNVYLHKDFHIALSVGIEYLHKHYGADSVRDYLRQFAVAFYSPLTARLKEEGLSALKKHIEKLYNIESGEIKTTFSEDELIVTVNACPAVTHIREHGYPVTKLFYETTKTVNEAICEGTPFSAELVEYDESTGRSIQRFFRRQA